MDSVAGGAAFLQGSEVVNVARSYAYLRAGYGPSGLQVLGDCDCPEDVMRALIGCEDPAYLSPAEDPAPWYDALQPESANFAGFLPTSFEGIESTYTRDIFPLIGGGGILGRLRAAPRELTWKGFLFGRTCCGVAYGLRWLTQQLASTQCGSDCEGETLDLLVCCPEADADSDCLPDAVSEGLDTEAFRQLYNVGLSEGPLVKSQRRSGCCGCSVIMEIEFTLTAGNPHLYRAPVQISDCDLFEQFTGDCDIEQVWVKVVPPAVCPDLGPVCPPTEPCTTDPGCVTPTLPVITMAVIDDCFCTPLVPTQIVVPVPLSGMSMNIQAVPIFELYAGAQPIRSTVIRIFENPQGLDCADIIEDGCRFCDTVSIRYIPAYSTLTINGITKRMSIECPGGDINPGEPFLIGNYSWPTLGCIDYCVTVEVDGTTIAADACFSMSVASREM